MPAAACLIRSTPTKLSRHGSPTVIQLLTRHAPPVITTSNMPGPSVALTSQAHTHMHTRACTSGQECRPTICATAACSASPGAPWTRVPALAALKRPVMSTKDLHLQKERLEGVCPDVVSVQHGTAKTLAILYFGCHIGAPNRCGEMPAAAHHMRSAPSKLSRHTCPTITHLLTHHATQVMTTKKLPGPFVTLTSHALTHKHTRSGKPLTSCLHYYCLIHRSPTTTM